MNTDVQTSEPLPITASAVIGENGKRQIEINRNFITVIGVVGENGAGKTTTCEILQSELSQLLAKLGLEEDVQIIRLESSYIIRKQNEEINGKDGVSRQSLDDTANELRGRFGPDIIGRVNLRIIGNKKGNKHLIAILGGIRHPEDEEVFRRSPLINFDLIGVEATESLRLELVKARNRDNGDYSKTLDDLRQEDLLQSNINIKNLSKEAKYKVINAGALSDLHRQVTEVAKQIIESLFN